MYSRENWMEHLGKAGDGGQQGPELCCQGQELVFLGNLWNFQTVFGFVLSPYSLFTTVKVIFFSSGIKSEKVDEN